MAFPPKTLDSQISEMLSVAQGYTGPSVADLPLAQARVAYGTRYRERGITPTRRVPVEALELPTPAGPLNARLYRGEPGGALALYFHGGGFMLGDLDAYDAQSHHLTASSGVSLLNIDYRLAPEHPFPAASDDVLAAWRALTATPADYGIDPARIAVGGDSAGGNLTAALMHDIATGGLPMPKAQVLIYPAVDAAMKSRSMQALRDAYVLPADRVEWYMQQYLPQGQDRSDPRVAPVNSDRLGDQPQALIIHAGHDPLWDDGTLHAKALADAGVPVTLLPYPGQVHAFLSARRALPEAQHATSAICDWLRARL